MPPKAKITREMILDAAFELTRENGIENVNARSIAHRLGCSTQPVLYHFNTVDEIRQAVYKRAEDFQTEYTMKVTEEDIIMQIGILYVRFAAEERHLFRLQFQSDHFSQMSLDDLMHDPSSAPMIDLIEELLHCSREEATDAFMARFLMVHGMASMMANNAMVYDESTVKRILNMSF